MKYGKQKKEPNYTSVESDSDTDDDDKIQEDESKTQRVPRVEKGDQITGIIAPFLFSAVLGLSAISKLDLHLCEHQPFITTIAITATLTDFTCFVVFCIKFYQLVHELRQKEKDKCKISELAFSATGMGIATVGAFFFATNMDEQINFLKDTRLTSLKLPPDWVAPFLFIFAILFIGIAALIAPKKPVLKNGNDDDLKNINEKNKCLPWDLNCKAGIAVLIQMPGIYMLYLGSHGNIDTKTFKCTTSTLLFLGAIGAFYLFLDGVCKLNSSEQERLLNTSIGLTMSKSKINFNDDNLKNDQINSPSKTESYIG